jgi:hypothetical protein
MWTYTPEAVDLLAAFAFAIGARIIDRSQPVPTPRSPKYDDAAHAERARKLLSRRIATLPAKDVLLLGEVAALLEAGVGLEIVVARQKLGKRRPGKVQVQPREVVERGERAEAKVMAENRALEEAERAAIVEAVATRRRERRERGPRSAP